MQGQPQSGYNPYVQVPMATQESVTTLRENMKEHYATKHYVVVAALVPVLMAVTHFVLALLRILPNLMD